MGVRVFVPVLDPDSFDFSGGQTRYLVEVIIDININQMIGFAVGMNMDG